MVVVLEAYLFAEQLTGDNFTDTAGETYNVCRLSFVCIDMRNVVGGKTVFIASSKIYLLELRDFSADSNALSIEKFERLVIQFRNRPINLL